MKKRHPHDNLLYETFENSYNQFVLHCQTIPGIMGKVKGKDNIGMGFQNGPYTGTRLQWIFRSIITFPVFFPRSSLNCTPLFDLDKK